MIASASKPESENFLEVDKLTESSEFLDISYSNETEDSPQMTIFFTFRVRA